MISSSTENRELITLGGGGVLLHGTYHKGVPNALGSTRNIGVLFLNALSTPRSLMGDSGIYWANSFAAQGFPAFRFDLPGLGDSYGEIPNDLLKFTNEGGWAAIASSKVKELVANYGLSGVVMFGHCAGASTVIYAAAAGCGECKGLILMDPYFNLPRGLTPALRPGLVLWVRRSRTGAVIRAAYDWFREMRGALRKEKLPANANFSLISRVKQVVSRGLPILILKSPQAAVVGSNKLQTAQFDYLAYVTSLAVDSNQFTVKAIEDTDHSFSNRAGRMAVRQHSENWLSEYFPPAKTEAPLVQDVKLQSMETNPVTVGAPVPACVSSEEIGARG